MVRPYRAGMPIAAALAVLEKDRDTKLDGRVLDVLAQVSTEMPLQL